MFLCKNSQMKQTKSYPRPSKIRYRLERVWLRLWLRKLIIYLSIILVFSTFCIVIFVYSNDWIKLNEYKNYFKNYIFERPELSVSKLEIKTANLDLVNQINAILKLSFPINSIKLDINHIQKIINQIDSVESSNVRINDSGVLLVEVIERKPVAVYRENDDLALIDLKGYKINNIFSRNDRKDLPLIVGTGGNYQVKEALEIYQLLSIYLNEIRGLIRIGERRWDIIFKNNKRIKLSEKYPKRSLRNFLSSDKSYLISSNDFVIIDLRFTNKIILRRLTEDITKP